jgi:hypothetical protein
MAEDELQAQVKRLVHKIEQLEAGIASSRKKTSLE